MTLLRDFFGERTLYKAVWPQRSLNLTSRNLLWYGAITHTGRVSMTLLSDVYGERIVYKDVWPQRSPNLTSRNLRCGATAQIGRVSIALLFHVFSEGIVYKDVWPSIPTSTDLWWSEQCLKAVFTLSLNWKKPSQMAFKLSLELKRRIFVHKTWHVREGLLSLEGHFQHSM